MQFFSGVQQIGIGVEDASKAYDWYKNKFHFSLKFFDDVATASLMTDYTGNKAEKRRAILALKKAGGGGLEIWQFKDRKPVAQPIITPQSLGILGAICGDLPRTEISADVLWTGSLGVKDPFGNVFVAGSDIPGGKAGIRGAVIAVSDLKVSESFYCDLLGFKKFREEEHLWDGIPCQVNSYVLEGKPALFSGLLGSMELKLVAVEIDAKKHHFENRYWGDQGFIHLCFECPGMDKFADRANDSGYGLKVDSAESFGMSDAAGRFGYIEDPDGTLIELVETHKIPVSKKLGLSLDLNKYKSKPIPAWILKAIVNFA
ncbi:VOC family protein [Luteibaculum oceani]|uniref:VOC family protein n=1 Tax=Luteibaculum oceani TaxID=1294296 RepID=A0A5C6UXZ0_9FLAO|nr:VOC family protein [Luteibaculum oceani]TXC77131.1 VOC family protein [Luteibaculum oceani]